VDVNIKAAKPSPDRHAWVGAAQVIWDRATSNSPFSAAFFGMDVSWHLPIPAKRPKVEASDVDRAGTATIPPTTATERQLRNQRINERGEYCDHASNALPFGSRAWRGEKMRARADER
jgi:hypothetical protein